MRKKAFNRRVYLTLGAFVLGMLGSTTSLADEVWPQSGKPIRIIVPLPAGSGSDVAARLLGKLMSDELKGHPVIIENKPGASTFIGAQEVARAPADGNTLLYTIVVTHTQNPHLYSKLPYDPVKDFTPLAQVMKSATVLIAAPNAPFNNLKELIAYAKDHPGALNYASYSPGSTSHLNAELLQMRTGTRMLHVPYKGATDASRALVAGDVQIYFDGTASAVSLIKAGKAKGIGSATPTRVRALTDLPTIQEQGVDGINIVGWQGVFGPGKMSSSLTDKVSALLSKVSRSKEMLSLIEAQGNEPSGAGATEFARIVADDSVKWGEVIKTSGIRLD